MRIDNRKLWTALAIVVLVAALGTALKADEEQSEGIVRISDQPAAEPETSALLPGGEHEMYYGDAYSGCDQCNGGRHSSYSPVHFFLTNHTGASHSPDYGWRRPAAEPIRRVPVEYRRYWPAKWYGEPGSGIPAGHLSYPMVYTPTDTTQLGYYYQRVPTWQKNPAMLPPKPWPAHWHRREACAPCYDGDCYGDGAVWSGGVHAAPEPAQADGPGNPEVAPPPPPIPDDSDKSARNWPLQSAGY